MQNAMRQNGIVTNPRRGNVPGAGGTVGLGQLVDQEGAGDVLMVMGTVMVGGIEVNDSEYSLDQTTPLAHVADDYLALVVPADSPHRDIDAFVQTFRTDPGSIAIGGGSQIGRAHV